jgi:phage-related protein HI1409|nr:MAG TPA: portal [Caudoviricetes sp.]
MELKINDSLENLVTKMGQMTANREYSPLKVTNTQLLNAYDNGWIAKRYIKKTIGDMLKMGREIDWGEIDEARKADFYAANKRFEIDGIIKDLLFNVLLYGEAAILAVTDAAEETYQTPLSPSETIKQFIVFGKGEFKAVNTGHKFNRPTFYNVKGVKTHISRLCITQGGIKSYGVKQRESVSDIATALDIIKMFDAITLSVSDLIEECKIDIYKMSGYNEQIAAGNEDAILQRLRLINTAKSYSNAIAMDTEDEYISKENNLTGVAELWAKSCIVVAGALNRPISILFGEGAGGFSSGEEDNRAYYETINELQSTLLRPAYDFLDPFILGETLEYDFYSIDSLNDKEKAEILNVKSTALGNLLDKGVITEAIILKELKDEGLIKNISEDDITEAELLAKRLDEPADETDPFGTI